MLAKIRKEQNHFLAYFIDFRKLVPVNKVGAKILDDFFNRNYSISKIIKKLGKKNIQKQNVVDFLNSIKEDLFSPNQSGYPMINQDFFSIPIAVELQVMTQCNLRCKHCCQDNYDKIMSIEKIKNILKILNDKKIFEISLVGGEILLHPNFLDIIKLCNKYNFATTIVSNATLLDESLIKKLKKFKRTSFLISLEGIDKTNDEIRGPGVFKKVDKAIKLLKKNNIHVEISTTINSENIKFYKKLIEYSKKLNIPVNFNLFKPFKYLQKYLILKPKKYFEFIKDIFNERKRGAKIGITNASIVAELTGQKKRNECRATVAGLTINTEGYIIPCPFLNLAGFYKNKKFPKFNKNFVNTWINNKLFKEFRKRGLRECQACSYIFTGNINKKSPYGITSFEKYLKNKKA